MKLRHVLRIARWEVTKNAGGVDRKTLAIVGLALLAAGLVAPYAAAQGTALDSGIYRVGVSDESPYYDVVASDPTFAIREPREAALEDGRIDLLIDGIRIEPADSAKGRSALSELRSTVDAFNDAEMRHEPNQSAAFPVLVSLEYVEREGVQDVPAPGAGGGTVDDGDGQSDADDQTAGGSDGSESGADGSDPGSTDGGTDGTGDGSGTNGGGGLSGGVGGLAGGLAGGNASGTPADISPPFPFQSLVLAFLFVLPLNFIIQAYGSTMLSERLNRRGELLLVSPASRLDIVGGKTLPYFTAAIGITGLIAAGLDAPAIDPAGVGLSILAVTPIALLFLGATFVGAMFARSFKELTFVTVTVTVSLTTFAFVPAIFTDVDAIALISPLTIVVRNLQGQAVTLGEFAFSTLPSTLSAGVLFLLGTGLYREEDMFTQRRIPLKVLDALVARISGKWSVAAMSALLIPFVLVAELLGVAMLYALPDRLSVPTVLVLVVVIEEIAKSLHVYAGYVHGRFDRTLWTGVVLGAFSGLGFFVGEKLTLIAQVVGLPDIIEGQAALASGAGAPSPPMVLALFLAPLALHVVTAVFSAIGASRGKSQYVVGLLLAMVIHFAYNYTVVTIVGPF